MQTESLPVSPRIRTGAGRLRGRAVRAGLVGALAAGPLAMTSLSPVLAAEPGPSTVTVTWGSTTLTAGQQVSVNGHVSPAAPGRSVAIEMDTNGTWKALATVQTAQDGSFQALFKDRVAGTLTLRADAAATATAAEAASDPATITVAPAASRVSAAVSRHAVTARGKVTLSGRVFPVWGPRAVVLQRQVADGAWQPVASQTVRGGRYAFKVPTWFYGRFPYRVVAQASDSATEQASTGQVVQVRPPYKPVGKAASHAFFPGTPRWNPCAPIHYRVNTNEAPSYGLRDAKGAIARVSAATGLRFVYDGPTNVIPQGGFGSLGSGVDMVIAWARPSQSSMLNNTSGLAGEGGPIFHSGYKDAEGHSVLAITQGKVVINAAQNGMTAPGFGNGVTLGKLLMHEIGHAVGLEHTTDPRQVMYPALMPGPTRYGAGDLTGLARLGAEQGCLTRRW